MTRTILGIILLFTTLTSYSQTSEDLNINYMLRGHIFAKSSIKDSSSLGGFGGSDNLPQKMDDTFKDMSKGLVLKIDTTKRTIISQKYNAYNLFLCNNTDTVSTFNASDSRLNVIAEIFYKEKWQAIEFLPSSWCGNSYHLIFLKPKEYWTFEIPKFTGKINSKLRYKLILGQNRYIYSNEIATSFNKGQFINKERHKRAGIMDPYNE